MARTAPAIRCSARKLNFSAAGKMLPPTTIRCCCGHPPIATARTRMPPHPCQPTWAWWQAPPRRNAKASLLRRSSSCLRHHMTHRLRTFQDTRLSRATCLRGRRVLLTSRQACSRRWIICRSSGSGILRGRRRRPRPHPGATKRRGPKTSRRSRQASNRKCSACTTLTSGCRMRRQRGPSHSSILSSMPATSCALSRSGVTVLSVPSSARPSSTAAPPNLRAAL
mmetsp:Transcript_126458/g.352362  ORF Transcript_126458/g.352362 Transcript_126458/m.352362 type:complete len:224 (-) Transcript_126458:1090-1761(-)